MIKNKISVKEQYCDISLLKIESFPLCYENQNDVDTVAKSCDSPLKL